MKKLISYIHNMILKMNSIQKICLMFFGGSLFVFIISIEGNYNMHWDKGLQGMFKLGCEDIAGRNYIGLIAIFNIVASTLGFYLFKDQ